MSTELMKDKVRELMGRQWVTPVEALEKAQCFSLSQRAGDLRRAGVKVEDKWVELPSGKRIKAYRIAA
jgi:hypothetical protein